MVWVVLTSPRKALRSTTEDQSPMGDTKQNIDDIRARGGEKSVIYVFFTGACVECVTLLK